MRALVQRVAQPRVTVDGQITGEIGPSLLILICAMRGDTPAQSAQLAAKIAKLRIFKDDQGKMNLAVTQAGNAALIVSQFTLAADLRGNRPGFSTAAIPEDANRLYRQFTADIAAHGITCANGLFGADMAVSLINDGPVTIWLDTATL